MQISIGQLKCWFLAALVKERVSTFQVIDDHCFLEKNLMQRKSTKTWPVWLTEHFESFVSIQVEYGKTGRVLIENSRCISSQNIPSYAACAYPYSSKFEPEYLAFCAVFNRDFHDYLTRSRFNLYRMSLRYRFAICSQAPTIWNDMPLTVRDSLTTSNFKKKIKIHF